ncbi:MAG: hypothetical protein GY740_02875, partial [Gammaproteobacteria bacterium]|nr:hypothetical protein [Gammaproteobacteria bacterium]
MAERSFVATSDQAGPHGDMPTPAGQKKHSAEKKKRKKEKAAAAAASSSAETAPTSQERQSHEGVTYLHPLTTSSPTTRSQTAAQSQSSLQLTEEERKERMISNVEYKVQGEPTWPKKPSYPKSPNPPTPQSTSETEEDDISKRLRDTVAAVASAEIPVPKPAVVVVVENQEEEDVDDTGCNPLYHLPTPQPHNSQNPRTTVIYCCTN